MCRPKLHTKKQKPTCPNNGHQCRVGGRQKATCMTQGLASRQCIHNAEPNLCSGADVRLSTFQHTGCACRDLWHNFVPRHMTGTSSHVSSTQSCFVRPAERPLNDGRAAARREVGRREGHNNECTPARHTARHQDGWVGGENLRPTHNMKGH